MELRSGKEKGNGEEERRSEASGSETQCLLEMLREMEKKREEEERKREEREAKREAERKAEKEEEERKRQEESKAGKEEEERKREEREKKKEEERKAEFNILMEMNEEIKNTLEVKIQEWTADLKREFEEFQKKIDGRIITMEKKNEEMKQAVNINKERCENRTKLVWEEINRVQENNQVTRQEIDMQLENINRKIEENERRTRENESRSEGQNMTTQDKREIQQLKEELKKELENLKGQQNTLVQNRIIYCNNNSQINKFDGKVTKLHPIVFIKTLKNKTRHLTEFNDVREIIRESLERESFVMVRR